ncbi:hypothetical protein XSR1_650006 [Xenorhabdus szentirmaii DSM 16338]|uniref:Uncharacterized protein n=1 Tax=Xenorhabdus szentirmaii DSM 16338 TaxID=1427518 RepID=W1J384_9GAMM|nr:hypothetical protein XSR1_650006 [Xenorhabdus szentirmaii DSM 16338]
MVSCLNKFQALELYLSYTHKNKICFSINNFLLLIEKVVWD